MVNRILALRQDRGIAHRLLRVNDRRRSGLAGRDRRGNRLTFAGRAGRGSQASESCASLKGRVSAELRPLQAGRRGRARAGTSSGASSKPSLPPSGAGR